MSEGHDDLTLERLRQDPDLDAAGLFKADTGAMTLASGKRVNPLRMVAEDVTIEDIAHALARQCRFNGHVGGFLSVARHSIWVAEHVSEHGHPELALVGLLHDAAEAYLGDMIRPLKRGAIGETYRVAEELVERAVAERFGLPFPWPAPVMAADNQVLLNIELSGIEARWTWTSSIEDDELEFLGAYQALSEVGL